MKGPVVYLESRIQYPASRILGSCVGQLPVKIILPAHRPELIELRLPRFRDAFNGLQGLDALTNGPIPDEQIDGRLIVLVLVGRLTPGEFVRVMPQDRLHQAQGQGNRCKARRFDDMDLEAAAAPALPFAR